MSGNRILTGVLCVLLLASVGLLMPVAADEHDLDEVRDRRDEFVYILGEGEAGILEIQVPQDGGFNYVVNSGQRPITFNLHSEDEQGRVDYLIGPRNSTTRESGSWTAPADGVYTIVTERREPLEATVRLNLDGTFGIVNMTGMEPATEVPGPAVLPIVGSVLGVVAIHRRRGQSRAGEN